MVAIAVSRGYADTPASQVDQQTVQPTQTYPEVPSNGEGWFDVGGFCKVVDVGDLSTMTPPASAIPVFVPGPADQWENYRTSGPSDTNYHGRLSLTTCCRPQANVATLCANGINPTPIDRQYGKIGETDQISGTCEDSHGLPFTDTVSVSCQGDNGPDGQAAWQESGDAQVCSPNAFTGSCNATCPSGAGTQIMFDSCGNPQRTEACSISCCTQSVSVSCNQSTGARTLTSSGCGLPTTTVPDGQCTLTTQSGTCSCQLSTDFGDEIDDGNGCSTQFIDCGSPQVRTGFCTASCVATGTTSEPAFFVSTPGQTCAKAGQFIADTHPANILTCTESQFTP